MKWIPRSWSRSRYERELDDELQHHLTARAADLETQGMSPDEARRRAAREFGSVEAVKDYTRDHDGWSILDEAWRNTIFALRRWRRRPALFGAILVTLAVCIGANAVMFSAVDAVLLRALPYPDAHRLYSVGWTAGQDTSILRDAVDGAMWFALEDATGEALRLAVYTGGAGDVNFVRDPSASEPSASLLRQQRVGSTYFEVFGVPMSRGRAFSPTEDTPGGADVTVLSWDLWQREFGGADVLGQAVSLAGRPHTVVGVAGRDFEQASGADLWVPLRPSRTGEGSGTNYQVLGRLQPGASMDRARAELMRAAEQTVTRTQSENFGYLVRGYQEAQTAGLRTSLLLLWAATGLVLLLGSVNVAGLLLAHASERSGEFATRRALGGGFAAVVRQLLTESALLGLGGAALGLAVGWFGLRWFSEAAYYVLGLWQPLQLDGRLIGAVLLLTAIATAAFGLAPAALLARSGVGELRTRGVTRTSRTRGVLVVVQVALGVGLLLVAGLLVRTFLHLGLQDPGVDTERLLAASVSLRDERFAEDTAIQAYFERGRRTLEERPEIEAAGMSLSLPYQRGLNMPLFLPGEESPSIAMVSYVLPGTLDVLGVRRSAGRTFDERDVADSPRSAVVSEQFVDMYLQTSPGGAIGNRFTMAQAEWEIVGVVGDIRQRPSFGDVRGPLASEVPTVYVPQAQLEAGFFRLVHTWFPPHWVVRIRGEEGAARVAVRDALRAVDPLTPVATLRDLGEERNRALRIERFLGILFSALAVVALLLATVGVAGISASTVAERRKSFGIRMALGSGRASAVTRAALPGLSMVAVGIGCGLLLAQGARTALSSVLYGVGFSDPWATAGAVATMLVVAGVAGVLPALRIARLSLVDTLQEE